MGHRLLITALCLLLAPVWGFAQSTQPTTAPARERTVVIPVSDMIDDYNRDFIKKRFDMAREMGATTVILKIDSYGGLVTSALDISRFIKQQTDLHTIAYVHQKAISAASMIAIACNEIIMEPHAQIGDSGVIRGDGQPLEGTERAKMESLVVEDFRDSAVRNGYSVPMVEAMVVMSVEVYYIEHAETGERRLVNGPEYRRLTQAGTFADSPWKPVEGVRYPVDSAESLLTLNTDLAIMFGLAKEKHPTIEAFAASRGLDVIATLDPDFGERVIGFLSSMTVRGLMVTVLMFALYMSFSTPGQGAPEAVALIAIAVLLGVPFLTGYAQWYEIVAVLLGVVLIAIEVFLLPGFGFAGITGLLLVLGGLTMTFVPPIDVPSMPVEWGGFSWQPVHEGLMVVLSGMVASLLLWWWLSRYMSKLPYVNRLVLTTTVGSTIDPTEMLVPQTAWPTIGAVGMVTTDLRPGGTASFDDPTIGDVRVIDVVTDRGFVVAGTRVAIKAIEGSRIIVRPIV